MTIEEIIDALVEERHGSSRTRIDFELLIDGKQYTAMAYKIRNQNLIRIDIRQVEKPKEE